MVRGLNNFKEWFKGYESHFAIIGGTACDLLMSEAGVDFRGTRDIDIVLLVEVLDKNFFSKLWDYIKKGGYEHRGANIEKPRFYRFSKPASNDFPHTLELFTRRLDDIFLPDEAVLTPLPAEDDLSSLSAILIDDGYYAFLKSGIRIIDGLPILGAEHLIPFKAKAWLDLSDRKTNGAKIDSKDIKKHINDIIKLSSLLQPSSNINLHIHVSKDLTDFIATNKEDYEILRRIASIYGIITPSPPP
jgi:hypothetical protein